MNQTLTCGASHMWELLVPESSLVGGAKPKLAITSTPMHKGTVWNYVDGTISGIPTEPALCAWRNWTVTMTDTGGSTTCGGGIKVMADLPKISYPKETLMYIHDEP